MKASSISRHERSFLRTGIDALGKKFILKRTRIADTSGETSLRMITCRRENGDESFIYKEAVAKERIILHFTVGYLKGDIATLTTPQHHVSVPYVIARNGNVFNLWDDKWWSYHLGAGASGGNTLMSKTSVGVELSNIGWLVRKGRNLVTSYSNNDIYCPVSRKAFYHHLPVAYRGRHYFASFTMRQYSTLARLLKILTGRHSILTLFLPEQTRYDLLANAASHRGILSHVNFIASGKWDIGPAFEWDKLVRLTGAGIIPVHRRAQNRSKRNVE